MSEAYQQPEQTCIPVTELRTWIMSQLVTLEVEKMSFDAPDASVTPRDRVFNKLEGVRLDGQVLGLKALEEFISEYENEAKE